MRSSDQREQPKALVKKRPRRWNKEKECERDIKGGLSHLILFTPKLDDRII